MSEEMEAEGEELIRELQNEVKMLELKNRQLKEERDEIEHRMRQLEQLELKNLQLEEERDEREHRMRQLERQLDMEKEKQQGCQHGLESAGNHDHETKSSSAHVMPLPQMERFDGDDWECFITQFNCLSECCRWTDQQKLFMLLHHVEGDAHQFVFVKSDGRCRSSFDNLVTALSQRFGVQESCANYRAKLDALSFTPQDCLGEYCADIQYLVGKAWPKVDKKSRAEMEVDYFLRKLEDPNMLRIVGNKAPQSIDEAREMTDTYIRIEQMAQPRSAGIKVVSLDDGDSSRPTKLQQLRDCISHLDKKLTGVCKAMIPWKAMKSNRRCYSCRGLGHFAKNCIQLST